MAMLGNLGHMKVNGGAIRAIREGKGVSQSGLARQAGCSASLISRLEAGQRGRRYLTDEQLLPRIADALGVSVSALVRTEAA